MASSDHMSHLPPYPVAPAFPSGRLPQVAPLGRKAVAVMTLVRHICRRPDLRVCQFLPALCCPVAHHHQGGRSAKKKKGVGSGFSGKPTITGAPSPPSPPAPPSPPTPPSPPAPPNPGYLSFHNSPPKRDPNDASQTRISVSPDRPAHRFYPRRRCPPTRRECQPLRDCQ